MIRHCLIVLRRAKAQPFVNNRWFLDVREDAATLTRVLLGHCAPGDALFVTDLTSATRWTANGLGDEALSRFAERSSRPAI